MNDPLVGRLVRGRFRVTGVLGQGGMSTVYDVVDETTGELRALKRLNTRLLADPTAVVRFQREAHIVAGLRHPHVVQVDSWAQLDDQSPCMVMERLSGETLSARIAREGGLPWAVVATVADQVMSALEAAHALGVIHCDIKPANVFLIGEPGQSPLAKLLDFGVARVRDHQQQITGGDATMGTPAYMSPEQAMGKRRQLGPASDVWGMAAMLHEMIDGRRAFAADGVPALVHRICYGKPEPLRRADVPAALRELLARALGRDEQQITSMSTLRAGVRAALAGLATDVALGPPAPERADSADTWAASGGGARTNIDAERDRFFGRADDEVRAGELLGRSRLVTLLGPGGVGKTRLARRLGRRLAEVHAGGAWFVDLASARDVDGLVRGLARALEVPVVEHDADGGVGQLGHALHARGDVLLVLDNLEQVIGPAATVVDRWLAAAPRLRLLVTSRRRLDVRGEQVVELAPLAADQARELLLDRAAAIDPGFAAHASDTAVAQICRRLDNLPLAIELAAARANLLSAGELLARLERRFDLLVATGGGDARQRTLRAAIDWSWDLLDPVEQAVLAQLSLFATDFGVAAAEQVVVAPDGAPPIIAVLAALRDRSLLVAAPERRLGLLESIREYAADKLVGEARSAAERRFCAYHAAEAEQLLARAHTPEGVAAAQAAVAGELENLLAAQRLAAGCAPRLAVRLAIAMDPFLAVTGPGSTWLAALDRGVAAATDEVDAARVLTLRCNARRVSTQFVEGRRDGEAAVARSAGDAQVQGWALAELIRLEVTYGDAGRATQLLPQLRQCVELAGDRRLRLREQQVLGTEAFYRKSYDESIAHDRIALTLAREIGDPRLLAFTLTDAATTLFERGFLTEAAARAREALDTVAHFEVHSSRAMAMGTLGLIAQETGDLVVAEQHLRSALAVHREVGFHQNHAVVQGNLAVLHHQAGRIDEAVAGLHAAIATMREIDDRYFLIYFLANLGALEADRDRASAAEAAFEEAAELAPDGRLQHDVCRGHLELLTERATRALGDDARADAARTAALSILHRAETLDEFKASDVRIACAVLRASLSRSETIV